MPAHSVLLRLSNVAFFVTAAFFANSHLIQAAKALGTGDPAPTGSIAAWGDPKGGLASFPPGLTNPIALATGPNHALALTAEGEVVAWGTLRSATNVPAGLRNVISIAAGEEHCLALRAALKADGTVTAFGWNQNGQTDVPPGLDNVVAVAGGFAHSLALRADGTVAAWGRNDFGQASVPAGLSNVTSIAAGAHRSYAVVGDGKPVLLAQPGSARVFGGATVTLQVRGFGGSDLSYQWLRDGEPVPGATSPVLVLENGHPDQSGSYLVELRNSIGSVRSRAAVVEVLPLAIRAQPAARFGFPGGTAEFAVTIEGPEPFAYGAFPRCGECDGRGGACFGPDLRRQGGGLGTGERFRSDASAPRPG